ncbi:MAG: carbon-nitrogen hydrolase family protein [Lachnospiraceae bacterium]|nr:carbon-nitrogen hydrolase family protein [Lachnospiraceae bacterium]
MRVIQCQTKVFSSKEQNLRQMAKYIDEASEAHPDLVTFGEMFTCPYDTSVFADYAEPDGGPSCEFFSDMAGKYHIWLSAGTIPERDAEGRIYNTAYVFDRDGNCVAKHRKKHLFDIDIRAGAPRVSRRTAAEDSKTGGAEEKTDGHSLMESDESADGKSGSGQRFRESDVLTAGDEITVFDTEFGKAALAVCFDVRFPADFVQMASQGVKLILIPASFNTTTGPLHWELLMRARAVDTQSFVIATSPARDLQASYHSFGHSLIADPWGKIPVQTDEAAGLSGADIQPELCDAVRAQIPLGN